MKFKKWTVANYDKEIAKMLAAECDADPFLALIASSRGYSDPYDFEEFISDECMLSSPYEFSQMHAAVERINSAVQSGEKITVFGDYDCDGITASALVFNYLKQSGADVDCYIPDRLSEGYGLNSIAIEQIAKNGTTLIITVDNGINSVAEVDLANNLGVDVIITDHHLPTGDLPKALAVIDPYSDESYTAFKPLAGVGVAFKLVCALADAAPEEMLYEYGDLVCVGTISDVMPLNNENRSIVKAGLPIIKSGKNLGLKALIDVSGYGEKELTATSVSFTVAPRINAAGRMGNAKIAFDLLCAEDDALASSLAEQINEMNILRQNTEQEITEQAINIIEQNGYNADKIIVVCGNNWHHGVIGISAARISEKYSKPVIVFSSNGEKAIGSARSIKGFSIFDAINNVQNLTLKFGGHEQAAGVTVLNENVDEFRRAINKPLKDVSLPVPEILLDCKLKISAINLDLCHCIEYLAPFGAGNPVPLFGVYSVVIDRITPIGNGKHLRLLFKKDYSVLSAVMFSCTEAELGFAVGDVVDIAVNVSASYYNGEEQVNVQVKAIKTADSNGEKAFLEHAAYNEYLAGKADDLRAISPSREEVGLVFKSIEVGTAISLDRFVNKLLNSLSVAKILLSVDILNELKFVKKTDVNSVTFLEKIPLAPKNDLSNSPTYMATRGD